jgi:hypothetical protein
MSGGPSALDKIKNLQNNTTPGDPWVVDDENKNETLKGLTDISAYYEAFNSTPEYINGIMETLYILPPGDPQKQFNENMYRDIYQTYQNVSNGVYMYDDGRGGPARPIQIPPEAFQEMKRMLKARKKAIDKIMSTKFQLAPPTQYVNPGTPVDDFDKEMNTFDYYNDVLANDPVFHNLNGTVDIGGGLSLNLAQALTLLQNPARNVNLLLNQVIDRKREFRKIIYKMQDLSCLYQGRAGPGELVFGVSVDPNKFEVAADTGGFTVRTANPADGSTYVFPIYNSRDYLNLMQVAKIVNRDSRIAAGNKLDHLNRCQSFPSILRVDMLRLKPGYLLQKDIVNQKPNSDVYFFGFKNAKGKIEFQIPIDDRYYKLTEGKTLYARADGIVVELDIKTQQFSADLALGTYAMPDGMDAPFLPSDIQTNLYAELQRAAATLNASAEQVISDPNIQLRLKMFAYIRNYELDREKVMANYEGFNGGGGRRRRYTKSGGSGSKNKLKKMTRKRKNKTKSKH